MSAKNIVKILPPSVLGERSPNPTVHIVTEDCVCVCVRGEKGDKNGEEENQVGVKKG